MRPCCAACARAVRPCGRVPRVLARLPLLWVCAAECVLCLNMRDTIQSDSSETPQTDRKRRRGQHAQLAGQTQQAHASRPTRRRWWTTLDHHSPFRRMRPSEAPALALRCPPPSPPDVRVRLPRRRRCRSVDAHGAVPPAAAECGGVAGPFVRRCQLRRDAPLSLVEPTGQQTCTIRPIESPRGKRSMNVAHSRETFQRVDMKTNIKRVWGY